MAQHSMTKTPALYLATALLVGLAAAGPVAAAELQPSQQSASAPRPVALQSPARDQQADVVNRYLFQPRIVLAGADEIELTADQRAAVEAAVEDSRVAYRRARFELANAMTQIAGIAVQHPVDEGEILAQLDRILEIERELKRGQLTMLVRVKNALTPEQHLRLEEIKARQFQRMQRQD